MKKSFLVVSLAFLIALSGCKDDSKSSKKEKCETGAMRCSENIAQGCANGKWNLVEDCGEDKCTYDESTKVAYCVKETPDTTPDETNDEAAPDVTSDETNDETAPDVTPDETNDETAPDVAPDTTPDETPDETQDEEVITDPCTKITVDALNGDYLAKFTPNIGKEAEDLIAISFWNKNLDFEPVVGTYELDKAPNNNFRTCEGCILLYGDVTFDEEGIPTNETYYFQSEGLLKVDEVQNLPGGLLPRTKGSLSNVKLVEVTIDPKTYESTPVENGKCIKIDSYSWDNFCVPNCENRECGTDGCGGTCGSLDGKCADDKQCSAEGKCVDYQCTDVTVDEIVPFVYNGNVIGFIYEGEMSNIGAGGVKDMLQLRFLANPEDGEVIDLAEQTDFSLADFLVLGFEDLDENFEFAAVYFQNKGTLTFDRMHIVENKQVGHSKGSIDNLRLVQIDSKGKFVQGGKCLTIAHVEWDTMPECVTNMECTSDPDKTVCDPATWTCVGDCHIPGNECQGGLFCSDSGVCEKPQGENNRCDGSSPITTITTSGTYEVDVSTTDFTYTNDYAPSEDCSMFSADDNGKDVAFKIVLTQKSDVLIDVTSGPETGFGADTIAWIGTTCGAADIACNDDRSGDDYTSKLELKALNAGTYYLVIDTNGANSVGVYIFDVNITPVVECTLDEDCSGYASCVAGSCVCDQGFTGENCNVCEVGYTGELCNTCDEGYHTDAGKCVKNIAVTNGDFSSWSNDTTPEGWTTTTSPTITKVDRGDENGFAIGLNKLYSSNSYLINSPIINVTDDAVPQTITFDLKGSGKMSINLRCGAPYTTTSDYKPYNLASPDNQKMTQSGQNAYNLFDAANWTLYTIELGDISNLWKEGNECKLEIKAGKDVTFDASFDNFKINY